MSGELPRKTAANRRKRPIRAHGWGDATHNMASTAGELLVTIHGRADKEPDRAVALVLDEDGIKELLQHLRAYALL